MQTSPNKFWSMPPGYRKAHGTQAAFEVWLAIPPHTPTPRIEQSTLRVVRMSGPAPTEGIEPIEIGGVQVPVFNAAKTVADCFKYHSSATAVRSAS